MNKRIRKCFSIGRMSVLVSLIGFASNSFAQQSNPNGWRVVKLSENAPDSFLQHGTNSRQWLSPECTVDLIDASVERPLVQWSEEVRDRVNQFGANCEDIILALGQSSNVGTSNPNGWRVVKLSENATDSYLQHGSNLRQWLNPSCTINLIVASVERSLVQWNDEVRDRINQFGATCEEIVTALGQASDSNNTNPNGWRVVKLSENATDSYLQHGSNLRQWLNPSCTIDLIAANVQRTSVQWADEVRDRINQFGASCDEVIAALGQPADSNANNSNNDTTNTNNDPGNCTLRTITPATSVAGLNNTNAARWDFSTGSCGEDPVNVAIRTELNDQNDVVEVKIDVTNSEVSLPDASNDLDIHNRNRRVDNRGLRTYCHMSHFSYDDPVVKPTGSAHLHMFWGNTGTDQSTDKLDGNVSSTCDGGIRNRSAYWMPAMFNEQLEVVVPRQVLTYYKTVGAQVNNVEQEFPPGFSINDIPDDLQILADKNVLGYSRSGCFKVGDCSVTDNNFENCVNNVMTSGTNLLSLKIAMPNCVALKNDGTGPALTGAESSFIGESIFNQHLAYSQNAPNVNGFRADNYCPTTHPFRIPQVELVAFYDIPGLGEWQLSSDHMEPNLPKGSTLHADYIAKWERGILDPETRPQDLEYESAMSFMVRCNMAKANCEHGADSPDLFDRFTTEGGAVYDDGAQITNGTIKPFVVQPPRMRNR